MQNINKIQIGGGNGRNSALELLRIVAMFLVLMCHYVPHRGLPSPESLQLNTWETVVNLQLRSLYMVCVNVFVIISGYFGIRWRKRSIKKLVSDIWFWLILAVMVEWIWFDLASTPMELIRLLTKKWCAWFIVGYLGLYLFAPVLNSFIDKASSAERFRFVLIYWGFTIFYGYITYGMVHMPVDFNEGMSILAMIGLYLIGASLRGVESKWLGKTAKGSLWRYLLLSVLMTIFAVGALTVGITASPYGYLNPIIVAESVLLFMVFKNMKPFESKIINSLAGAAFSVYIVHQVSSLTRHYHDICEYIENNFEYSLPVALLFMISLYLLVWGVYLVWRSLYSILDGISVRWNAANS